MAELPHPWDAYASAQAQLSNRTALGDRSWGLEAALNQLVVNMPPSLDQLATVQASAERRTRYGRALIARNATPVSGDTQSVDSQIEARSDLIFLGRHLSARDMASLLVAGFGHAAASDAARQRLARARRRARSLLMKHARR
ncbi:MAG: hypothetical protein JSR45_08860 [Proteobacteria bacterium]|nr:hypothetical protein [Pseudomonadota bacterium]